MEKVINENKLIEMLDKLGVRGIYQNEYSWIKLLDDIEIAILDGSKYIYISDGWEDIGILINYIIDAMEKNNYNFKIEESGWDDTITLVLIGKKEEDIFHITIDFNIELEKIYIFEVYNGNVELISNYDLHDFMKVTSFIENFYEYN